MKKSIAAIALAMISCGLPLRASAQLDDAQYQYVAEAEMAADKEDKPKADEKADAATAAPASCGDSTCCASTCNDGCGCGCNSCGSGCGCGDSCCAHSYTWPIIVECCGDICCASSCCFSPLEGCTMSEMLGMDKCCGWEVGGWTEAGYTNNNVPLSQAYNDLLSFNDVPDNLNINQQWFYIGKKADGSNGLDWGFRIDSMYGTDAQKTQAFGNPNGGVRGFGFFDASWDNGQYGFAMPQLYAEVAYGDLTTKVGHFFNPGGYEVIPATGNFFYTHSYTMFNSEAFTYTGVLSQYKCENGVTLYGGWTLGWDTGFDQLNQGNTFLTGFSNELNDCTTFTYILDYGNFGWRDGGDSNSYQHSAVFNTKLTCNLDWVLQGDVIETSNPGVSEFDTVGAVNYLFYKLSDKTKLGTRVEWWKADGVSFYEATFGVNLNLAKNCVLRPEWRQDWAPGIGLDEDTFGVDMVLTY